MIAINDGTKSDFGDGSPLGMCDCSCSGGDNQETKTSGFHDFGCGCSCGFWTQEEHVMTAIVP
jgi:hypothetical protein